MLSFEFKTICLSPKLLMYYYFANHFTILSEVAGFLIGEFFLVYAGSDYNGNYFLILLFFGFWGEKVVLFTCYKAYTLLLDANYFHLD